MNGMDVTRNAPGTHHSKELAMTSRLRFAKAVLAASALVCLAVPSAWSATAPTKGKPAAAKAGKANLPPVARIDSPAEGTTFLGGSMISLAGSATDDRDASGKLVYQWDVDALLPDGGRARVLSFKGRNATFAPRGEGLQDPAYEVRLVVTDTKLARDTATVTIRSGAAPVEAAAGEAAPLQPGDVVEVEIYAGGEKQEDFTVEVSRSGTLTCPLVGEIPVGGVSANELSTRLRTILARDFFVDPQVLVTVKEYPRKIFVSGEVKNPGAYSIQDGLTVMSACTIAGGFTDYAALNRVRVLRTERGTPRTIEVDLSKVRRGKAPDVALVAGDRVDVPHRRY
jgi:protein involved in polysaccharide export with SLBB domain